jgi:peptidoglycan/LPS O-acetylase OafA/YrhL
VAWYVHATEATGGEISHDRWLCPWQLASSGSRGRFVFFVISGYLDM